MRPATFLAVGLFACSLVVVGDTGAGEPALPALVRAPERPPVVGESEEAKLLRERYNSALVELRARVEMFDSGQGDVGAYVDCWRRLSAAGMELDLLPAARLALLAEVADLARFSEAITLNRFQAGRATVQDLSLVRYHRADAELAALREKKKSLPK